MIMQKLSSVALIALLVGAVQALPNGVLAAEAAAKKHYERWFNHYHDSVVYKVFLKHKGVSEPVTTIDQTMDLVKRIHDYSGGLHQIVYLVGWQFDGHDSKYPDWSVVGNQCKSSFSSEPVESLRKAMSAVQVYNADLSFHINMNDAYPNAPSWEAYKDVLCRKKDGSFTEAGHFGGEMAYRVSHVKEFKKGLAQKRILSFLEMFPDLRRSGTVHIDAFFGHSSDYDGISALDDFKGVCDITDFWHAQGVDVTAEFIGSIDHVGWFPMCYHLNLDEQMRLEVPPEVLCGGDDLWNTRGKIDYYHTERLWRGRMPTGGTAFEEAWGIGSLRGDAKASWLQDPHALLDRLFSTAFLFCYYNQSRPVRHWADAQRYVVERSNGVVATVRKSDRLLVVKDNGRLVLSGGDCLLDLPHGGGTFLAYSRKGCDREYVLPKWASGAERLNGTQWPAGEQVELSVVAGKIWINLPPQSSLVLRPKIDTSTRK